MSTQGPARAQGEITAVTIERFGKVTHSFTNGQGGDLDDDGKLDRLGAVDSDGSHSRTVQLWGSWQRCQLPWRARPRRAHQLQQAAVQKRSDRGPAEWRPCYHLVGRWEWRGGEHRPGRRWAGESAWKREVSVRPHKPPYLWWLSASKSWQIWQKKSECKSEHSEISNFLSWHKFRIAHVVCFSSALCALVVFSTKKDLPEDSQQSVFEQWKTSLASQLSLVFW